MQFIDVRDLGAWIVTLCEQRHATASSTRRAHDRADGELLEACAAREPPDADSPGSTSDFLVEHGVGEWMELPLWIAERELAGLHEADVARVAAGLTFRPARGDRPRHARVGPHRADTTPSA